MLNPAIIRYVIAIAIYLVELAPALAEFTHPGISHTQTSIDFVKEEIAAGEEPWATALEGVKSSRYAELDWRPQPRSHVDRGPYNNPNIGSSEFNADANASYRHALLWALTAKEAHAKKSAEILNAWSSKLKSISNHDARLLVGMEGYEYCNAAELLQGTHQESHTTAGSHFRRKYGCSSRFSKRALWDRGASGMEPRLLGTTSRDGTTS